MQNLRYQGAIHHTAVHTYINSKVGYKQVPTAIMPCIKGQATGGLLSNQPSKEPATQKWHLFYFKSLAVTLPWQNL